MCLRLCTDSSRFHLTVVFFFFFYLIRKRSSVCLCFADRDVWFLKCGCSLWARLAVYKINAAATFQWYDRSFPHTSRRKHEATHAPTAPRQAAVSLHASRTDIQATGASQGRARGNTRQRANPRFSNTCRNKLFLMCTLVSSTLKEFQLSTLTDAVWKI